ncbi:hypothetical protein ACVWW5_005054 [Bradyrhizobium sp. LM3.4]
MAHMQEFERIKVLFVAGFGPIVRDRVAGGKLYGETLNISFKKEQGGYLHTEALKGVRTFALWPLDQAAQSCLLWQRFLARQYTCSPSMARI